MIRIILIIVCLYLGVLYSSGCKRGGTGIKTTRKTEVMSVDSGIMLLRQGDLVLRRGRDMASYMISRCNLRDMAYSHCGLVQVENGYPFVYHSIDGVEGGRFGLQRDSARLFFSPVANSAIAIMRYKLNEAQLARQSRLISEYYTSRATFDHDFDLKTPDRLYCTEFVYRVMNAATEDSSFITTTIRKGIEFVPVENVYLNGHTGEVWREKFK